MWLKGSLKNEYHILHIILHSTRYDRPSPNRRERQVSALFYTISQKGYKKGGGERVEEYLNVYRCFYRVVGQLVARKEFLNYQRQTSNSKAYEIAPARSVRISWRSSLWRRRRTCFRCWAAAGLIEAEPEIVVNTTVQGRTVRAIRFQRAAVSLVKDFIH